MSSAHDLGTKYDAIVRRRAILLAAHVVFGLIAGLALILPHYKPRIVTGGGGTGLFFWHLFASWPYVLSAIRCYSGAVTSNGRLAIQLLVLAMSTGVAVALYLGAAEINLSGPVLAIIPITQFLLFSRLVIQLVEQRE